MTPALIIAALFGVCLLRIAWKAARRPKRREWPRYDYDFSDLPTIRRDSEALFVTERVAAARRIR
jgi:hypothetical protein